MKRHFEEELKELKEQLLYMGGIAESMINYAVKSLIERNDKYIKKVYSQEKEVNHLHINIDERCLNLLALRQPIAIDLRFIVAAIKINSELERIGDQAVNIAQNTSDLLKQPELKPLLDLPHMTETVKMMVKNSLDSFVEKDTDLAQNVLVKDNEVDAYKSQIFRELLTYMMSEPSTIQRALDLILIARNLEKVGDHATNIAEDVIFMVLAKDIRHHITEI